MAALAGWVTLVRRAVARNTSGGGLGFAGTTGLLASGLTDIASTLGALLLWFFAAAIALAGVLAQRIGATEARVEHGESQPPTLGLYCHAFAILIGAVFGSGILLLTGMLSGHSEGGRLLGILDDINGRVARVETKVDTVNEQVVGIGQQVNVTDISGRSGTGMIGDISTFRIALENEKLMNGASCVLQVGTQWRDRMQILDDNCAAFRVQLVNAPLLNDAGGTLGDVLQVPYDIKVLSSSGDTLGTTSGVYPFQNQYRSIVLELDPAGNRLTLGEKRRAKVSTPGAVIPQGVSCQWTDSTNPVIAFVPESDNRCEGWLSTEAEENSYAYKQLIADGEKRGEVYLQLVADGDFAMLGIAELRYSVSSGQ